MTLFNNKYRIETARAKNWDYHSAASYFITICTKEGFHYFGKIQSKEMVLNDCGIVVRREWIKTPEIRPDMNITLGEFVVMPNHFHGIISIGENGYNEQRKNNEFGIQSKNLGAIVGGFKASVTKQLRKINADFGWQERYHDHIIRDNESYERIRHYIQNNPANWLSDKFYRD